MKINLDDVLDICKKWWDLTPDDSDESRAQLALIACIEDDIKSLANEEAE